MTSLRLLLDEPLSPALVPRLAAKGVHEERVLYDGAGERGVQREATSTSAAPCWVAAPAGHRVTFLTRLRQ